MNFQQVDIESFGILQSTELADLPKGLTVVYGGNGCGKSTLVEMVRGIFFGLDDSYRTGSSSRFGGRIRLNRHGEQCVLERFGDAGLTVTDTDGRKLTQGVLPAWIDAPVFAEIFTPGYREADRFALLTGLCLSAGSDLTEAEEIGRTESALRQLRSERDGDTVTEGLQQRRAKTEAALKELRLRLDRLQRVSPDLPGRIAELERRIGELRNELSSIAAEVRRLEELIMKLEAELVRLRRRNVVQLDRNRIGSMIDELQRRRQQWREIRDAVEAQLRDLPSAPEAAPSAGESLRSIRALVSRLESRMDELRRESEAASATTDRSAQETARKHLRSEVYALCDYLARHENGVEAHELGLQRMLGERSVDNLNAVEHAIERQIAALRAESARSEDVLSWNAEDSAGRHSLRCESEAHRHHVYDGVHDDRTIAETESSLQETRTELSRLLARRERLHVQISDAETELARLKHELAAAASLEEIDRIRADVAEQKERNRELLHRIAVLNETERSFVRVIEELRKRRRPSVLDLAQQFAARLTEGECTGLTASGDRREVLVMTRGSDAPRRISQLSRGTRDQVALALRLALIEVQAGQHDRVPLILDDVFITSDDSRAAEAAALLKEIGDRGQQIIFLTCQTDARDVLVRHGAVQRTIGEPVQMQAAPAPEPIRLTTIAPPAPVPAPAPVVPEPQPQAIQPSHGEEAGNWLYYLEPDADARELAGLSVSEIAVLETCGIRTVDDLLTQTDAELSALFSSHNCRLHEDRVAALRGQAEMACRIPMLRRSDAELLYAAGLRSVEQLCRLRPETVYDMVHAWLNSDAGRYFRKAGRRVDRQQAINWTRWALHSRTIEDARRSAGEYRTDTNGRSWNRVRGSSWTTRIDARRRGMSESDRTSRRRRRPAMSAEARRARSERFRRRRRTMERSRRHLIEDARRENESSRDRGKSGWRFFLSRSSNVVDAPSIGPRSAERLEAIGIVTVDDLLRADPFRVAEDLGQRRIDAEVVRQWQAQARLVCQIPQLRGHDAQILVACGMTEVSEVASQEPDDLFSVVGPFSETKEGERIIRGGSKPDLEEVTDWITWARNSRPLQAA